MEQDARNSLYEPEIIDISPPPAVKVKPNYISAVVWTSVVATVEGVRRKKLAVKTRNVLNIIGAVLVLGIFAIAIASDILRLTGS